MNEWTKAADDTLRLEVPGGWLYRVNDHGIGVSMAFVPSVREHNDLVLVVEEQRERIQRLEVRLRTHEERGLCLVADTLRKAWDGATDEQHGLLEQLAESLGIEVPR